MSEQPGKSLNPKEVEHVNNCQFASWYSLFRALTPKTRILECPAEFRLYLLADGIQLPGEVTSDWSDQEVVCDSSDSSDSSDCEKATVPAEFDQLVATTIRELDGAVCPKLNWSAPRDAVWISPTNNMKCISPNDIYMLIKSSDYCTFDLTMAYGNSGPTNVLLVLREWFDITPSHEFRCFVRDGTLVGATQRDLQYYAFLHENEAKIETLLRQFVAKLALFPDKSFVADVYIAKDMVKVWLIDINPWLDRTDTLLFDWPDLKQRTEFELRLISRHDSTREFGSKPHTTNYVPHDFIDMNASTAEELVKELKKHT